MTIYARNDRNEKSPYKVLSARFNADDILIIEVKEIETGITQYGMFGITSFKANGGLFEILNTILELPKSKLSDLDRRRIEGSEPTPSFNYGKLITAF